MRVAVLGSSGLLGGFFEYSFEHWFGWEVTTLGRSHNRKNPRHAVISSLADALEIVRQGSFNMVVNCVAIASHEGCEDDVEQAFAVNAEFPGKLAIVCAQSGARLIQISTDAVFDGPHLEPFTEVDVPRPLSAYGRSKLEGENRTLAELPDALVVRTNFFCWSKSGRNGVLDFFFNALSQGREVPGFTDYLTSSIYAGDLSDSLRDLALLNYSGIIHIVSSSALSKFEFGNLVSEIFGLRADLIMESSLASQTGLAHRAPDLSLSPKLLEKVLGREIASTRDGIVRAKAEKAEFGDFWKTP